MSSQRQRDEPITQSYSLSRPSEFTKLDLKPRRYHFYTVLLFIFGTLFPPLAVAARFGIGGDFWLNLLLTVCGYIPGHAHNFYIQNIRNNSNNRRTPKWAVRYGLVDDSEIRRRKKRSQWSTRYNDRLPRSTLEGQDYAEDQVPERPRDDSASNLDANERPLWNREEDESYYGRRNRDRDGASSTASGGRWRYPANFQEADVSTPVSAVPKHHNLSLGGKKKKDRWALSVDARMGVLPDQGDSKVKKRKKKSGGVKRSKKRPDMERNSSLDSVSDVVEPEDPVGGLYGERRANANGAVADPQADAENRDRELFEHQF